MLSFNNADVCEEAHERTVKECKEKNISLDRKEDSNREIGYTQESYEIFMRHHTDVENEFEDIISAKFDNMVREEMSDKEFWTWVQEWKDVESLIEETEDWDIEDKMDALELYNQK